MSRIVISGYYGFNNMGDESILSAITTDLQTNIPNVEIVVLSANTELTEQRYKVKAINRKNIFRIIKEIVKCDVLVSGGGSLLQDVTSKRSILYYLGVMLIGIFFKKKVMIYSQGIGPIVGSFNRKMTKRVLEKVDIITLRDQKSKRELRDLGLLNPNIYVTADPVIALKKGDIKKGREILENEGLESENGQMVCFAIRGKSKTKKFIKDLAKLADRLTNTLDVKVVFVPFHQGEDIGILSDIKNEMKEKAIFLNKSYSIENLLGIIGSMDTVVGERLHSLIFSAVMTIPMIALSYDPKINNFMGYLSQEVFSDIDEVDFEKLYLNIEEKLSHEDEKKYELEKQIRYLQGRLKKNTTELGKLLEK